MTLAATITITACSDGDTTPTSTTSTVATTEATTTTSATTTTAAPTTTSTTAAPTTTTTTLAVDAVGDPELLEQQVTDLFEVLVDLGEVPDRVELFIPDLTNADPIVGAMESMRFEAWALEAGISRGLVLLYTTSDSEYQSQVLGNLSILARLRFESHAQDIAFSEASTVPIVDLDISTTLKSELPPGAVGVLWTELYPERAVTSVDTGDVEVRPPVGPRRTLTIVAPGPTGWTAAYQEPNYAG